MKENYLAICCQKELVVANWHFVAEILKKNVETEPAPSHVKNGMFSIKKEIWQADHKDKMGFIK